MRTKILVIDDEESLCEILKFNLEKEGYEVDYALSAEEALDRDDLASFSLFMVDIMMDKLSGFDFAKRMKNVTETEDIPILFCSALSDEDCVVMTVPDDGGKPEWGKCSCLYYAADLFRGTFYAADEKSILLLYVRKSTVLFYEEFGGIFRNYEYDDRRTVQSFFRWKYTGGVYPPFCRTAAKLGRAGERGADTGGKRAADS